MTLALAVVGAGRMGRRHVTAAGAAARVELRAVCDPLPGAAARAAPPGVASLADPAELDGLGVGAVVIAAPTPLHVELADRAIAMGLHVLCEKPVGFDPAAATALGERAAAAGRVLAVGFWRRCAWPYVEARRLPGRWGDRRTPPAPPQPVGRHTAAARVLRPRRLGRDRGGLWRARVRPRPLAAGQRR